MSEALAYPAVDDAFLADVVRRILTAGSPEKIVLFGSHARGDAREDSDVDLLIIEDSPLPRWERDASYYPALSGLGRAKDILVWTPAEVADWSGVPNFFVTEALREGVVLYER